MRKSLVAYYSWGNNTRAVAEYIAQKTGSDILELVPDRDYTTDYNTCVSMVGRDGRNSEPELKSPVPELAAYDVIYAGSPCWWGSIANPLRTFLHRNDFTGKEIRRIISADLGSSAINSSFFSAEIIKASLRPVSTPLLMCKSQLLSGVPQDSIFLLIDCSIDDKINQLSSPVNDATLQFCLT